MVQCSKHGLLLLRGGQHGGLPLVCCIGRRCRSLLRLEQRLLLCLLLDSQ